MLNEVKNLVLRIYGRFLHGTRFFVAMLLKNDIGQGTVIASKAKQSPSFLPGDCHVASILARLRMGRSPPEI